MKAEAASGDKQPMDDQAGAGHAQTGPTLWSESWYFDFVSCDGSAGGFVRFGIYPVLGVSWWWAYVIAASEDPPVIAGFHVERPLPPEDGAPFRLDDPGLEIELAPGRNSHRWRVSVQRSATLADAAPFALSIDWCATADPYQYRRGKRYEQPGWATGIVTAGGRRHAVAGPAQRDHSWGVRDWWRFPWDWCAGWLGGGARFQATRLEARGRVRADGYLQAPRGAPRGVEEVEVLGRLGPGAPLTIRLDDLELTLVRLAMVQIALVAPDGRCSRLDRSMVAVHARDGRRGFGWCERNQPDPRAS